MKKINLQNKVKINKKTKAVALIGSLVILLGLLFQVLKSVNAFFDTHYLKFNKVVEVIFNRPVEVIVREPEVVEIVLDYPDEIDTPLEKYICDKFGEFDCKTALAIAKAESGLQEDNYHYNSNSTIDIGIFQINQTHWGKEGCSPAELFIAEKNVDCAHQIWEASGWSPWVVYQTESYIKHIE